MKIRYMVMPALVLALGAPACAQSQTRTASPARSASNASASTASPPTAERREDWQRVPDIFSALDAGPGSRLADLGAGEGWLSTRLARLVGPSGRIFAADISESALNALRENLAKDSIRNVELILSEGDDPRLPYGTLDGVVIVNAYHEMTQRVAVLEGVKRALRPGGRLVILDQPAPDSITSRKEQMSRHMLALDLARDDLEAHGFEIVREQADFVSYKHPTHTHTQWLLVARKAEK